MGIIWSDSSLTNSTESPVITIPITFQSNQPESPIEPHVESPIKPPVESPIPPTFQPNQPIYYNTYKQSIDNVMKDGLLLEFVKKEFQTVWLIKAAVRQNPNAAQFIISK